jgi:hypothetical protein
MPDFEIIYSKTVATLFPEVIKSEGPKKSKDDKLMQQKPNCFDYEDDVQTRSNLFCGRREKSR